MLMAFSLNKGALEQIAINAAADLGAEVIWVDLIDPTEEERDWLRVAYAQELPTIDDLYEIEASSRFYENEYGLHISSYFLNYADKNPENISAAFVFNGDRLFTLREEELAAFRLFRMRGRKGLVNINNSKSILLGLFETKVENLADILERVHADLEQTSQQVLGNAENDDMESVLTNLASQEDINGKVRISMIDLQRMLYLLLRASMLNAEQNERLRDIIRDSESLIAHSSFLFDKIKFLLDTTLGFINVNQNKIIKIFSVASVMFLPPTMVASIYGMNFETMPELKWQYGYLFGIVLMLLSAILPFLYFKRRGWL
ncbi:MAG: magnesium/cobalt transporter CorA [Moraxellaceae bacterium]|jgi:magnesium transporter|nr:magnesium/cobalt transporter CorA [Moraxellaceae bacterium]MBK7299460.1 magnesium/cobalt transporter CorA [Moraxellaceae bacterium]MBK8327342.1 magnesium/cobalt transporter CorA [Moraxellaceae bacterium]MBK9187060.1 magnesium/cobalt transporter CorA [Moraxellaceae bacterium]HQV81157.1 magnesium/cobalt transporter CorA [Agitococcus sp.]